MPKLSAEVIKAAARQSEELRDSALPEVKLLLENPNFAIGLCLVLHQEVSDLRKRLDGMEEALFKVRDDLKNATRSDLGDREPAEQKAPAPPESTAPAPEKTAPEAQPAEKPAQPVTGNAPPQPEALAPQTLENAPPQAAPDNQLPEPPMTVEAAASPVQQTPLSNEPKATPAPAPQPKPQQQPVDKTPSPLDSVF